MNNTNFNTRLSRNLLEFKDLLKGFFPKGKIEILLFISFVIFYLLLSVSVVYKTSLIEGDGIFFFDLYFTFDNPLMFRQGYFSGHDVSHPLIRYINRPYMFISELLTAYWGVKAKTIFTVILCSSTVSLSIVYVYRYLKVIVNTDTNVSVLLSVFYGAFTTNMILSFTPESYTLTVFLLTYCIYYYSYSIKQDKRPSLLSDLFFSFGLGVITLTNFAKGLMPIFFVKGGFKSAVKKVILISVLFICLIALLELFTNSFSFEKTIMQKLTFVDDEVTRGSLFSRITDLFFIAPVLFLGVVKEPVQLLINGKLEDLFVINMDFVSHCWQYVYAIGIYGLVVWSIIINRRNKLVWLMLSVYLIDIVLHLLIGYGLKDPFIYGGHWVYILPLLLGWLYKVVESGMKKKLFYIYMGFALICIVNNIYQLYYFIELSIRIFPAQG